MGCECDCNSRVDRVYIRIMYQGIADDARLALDRLTEMRDEHLCRLWAEGENEDVIAEVSTTYNVAAAKLDDGLQFALRQIEAAGGTITRKAES